MPNVENPEYAAIVDAAWLENIEFAPNPCDWDSFAAWFNGYPSNLLDEMAK